MIGSREFEKNVQRAQSPVELGVNLHRGRKDGVVVGVVGGWSSIGFDGVPGDAEMMPGGVVGNEPSAHHFARVIILGENEHRVDFKRRNPKMNRGVVLEESADAAHLKAIQRFSRRVDGRVIESLSNRPAAKRVAVKSLTKLLVGLLSEQREVEMALKNLRLGFHEAQFLPQEILRVPGQ